MLLSKASKAVVFGFSGDPVGAKRAAQGMAARHEVHRSAGAAAASRRVHRAQGDRGSREEARDGDVVLSFPDAIISSRRAAVDRRRERSRQDLPRHRCRPLRCASRVSGPQHVRGERAWRTSRDAKLPSVSGWYPFAPQKGLLMTHGPNVRELYRSLARCTDRILKGTRPAKFYLAIKPEDDKGASVSSRQRGCSPAPTRWSSRGLS